MTPRSPIREQITPFAQDTQGTFEELRKTTTKLNDATPTIVGGLSELNKLFNALAFNPDGHEEGFLFWANWLGHNANETFTFQDANGPVLRAIVMQLVPDGVARPRYRDPQRRLPVPAQR